ncbi:nitroreductase [Desulfitispora alkaliphila]|uniref:nitroreductase family protein n=1 Tax=Desulfitispora alkaliphila TaxID=622674 RepID=UPI003D1EEFD0
MKLPVKSWHQAIKERHSVRTYDGKDVPIDKLMQLEKVGEFMGERLGGVRAVVVTENVDRAFKGFLGSYGKIKGASAYIAFIGDMRDPQVQAKIGYLGEALILEATRIKLSTCWVGGFFKPEAVARQLNISSYEEVVAITPLGFPAEKKTLEDRLMSGFKGEKHKRKPLEKITVGLEEGQWESWVKSGLEAARLAPSAVNRQPWVFAIEPEKVTLSINSKLNPIKISKRLDCGIALFHFELGAAALDVDIKWEFAVDPHVANICI